MLQAGGVVEGYAKLARHIKGLGLGLNPPSITEILLAAFYLLQQFHFAGSKTEDKEGRECLCKFYSHIVETRLQQNLDPSHRESARHQTQWNTCLANF